jgi:hypothetical protein
MLIENHFCVIESSMLSWPSPLDIPSRRFRLFVAADVTGTPTEVISAFAHAALRAGMVYFCAWGPDCSRFHDIVDLVIVQDELDDRLFVGASEADTVMTTWHEKESLTEALDFFITLAYPTDGFETDSNYWVAVSLDNAEWAATIRRQLGQAAKKNS